MLTFSRELDAPLGKYSSLLADMDWGIGVGFNGGFAYAASLSLFGYGFTPVRGISMGLTPGFGLDGIGWGGVPFSAHLKMTAYLSAGLAPVAVVARASNRWLHRDARQDGASHAVLWGDEVRSEVGIRVRVKKRLVADRGPLRRDAGNSGVGCLDSYEPPGFDW
jgi:hypothetical protein